MRRRSFLGLALLGSALAVAGSGAATAQADVLGDAFARLSVQGRMKVQEELGYGGFYSGAIDGSYGAGTRQGLMQAAAYIADNSRGKAQPDARTAAGAQAYLLALASGELGKWLYGEGDEGEGGF